MKKNLLRIFVFGLLFLCVEACDYVPNRSNIIAASRNVIDTGSRFVIIQRDTSTPLPITKPDSILVKKPDSLLIAKKRDTVVVAPKIAEKAIVNTNTKGGAVVEFAKTMIGKPYVYGVNTPEKGFDNAGFVNFVFNHFEIKLPKYAPAFIAVGESVAPANVEVGDIVLFSKTDSLKKAVYQVGIVVSAKGSPVSFIHASSGKINGVGISGLSSYYQKKLMGYRRMF